MSDKSAPASAARSANRSTPPRGRLGARLGTTVGMVACLLLLVGGVYLLVRPGLAWQTRARAAREAMARGEFPRARTAWEECLQVAPSSQEARLGLVRCYRLGGDSGKAMEHLMAARNLGGNREELEIETLLLRAQIGEVDVVFKDLQSRIPDGSPRAPEVQESVALGYLTTNRPALAGKWAESLLQARPDYWLGYWIRGAAADQEQRPAEAAKDFLRVLEMYPEQPETRLWLGRYQLTNKQYSAALENFQRLLREHPTNAEAAYSMAECYRGMGQSREAETALLPALKEARTRARALLLRGQMALEREGPQQALEWLRQAEAQPPPSIDLYKALVEAYQKSGDARQAGQYEDRQRRLQADLDELDRLRARVIKPDTATDEFLQICTQMGAILLRIGNEGRGIEYVQMALREAPDHKPAHQVLADYYEKKGDAERARTHRERAR